MNDMGWSGKMDLHSTDIISRLILFHQNLKQRAVDDPTSDLRLRATARACPEFIEGVRLDRFRPLISGP